MYNGQESNFEAMSQAGHTEPSCRFRDSRSTCRQRLYERPALANARYFCDKRLTRQRLFRTAKKRYRLQVYSNTVRQFHGVGNFEIRQGLTLKSILLRLMERLMPRPTTQPQLKCRNYLQAMMAFFKRIYSVLRDILALPFS